MTYAKKSITITTKSIIEMEIDKTQRIAELMNWPPYRAEMAIKHSNVPVVNKYLEILEVSQMAGAFLPEAKERPE